MKLENSKIWEFSLKDILNISYLTLSFLFGFYMLNIELVNNYIAWFIDPKTAWIITAFLYYTAKQFLQNNEK